MPSIREALPVLTSYDVELVAHATLLHGRAFSARTLCLSLAGDATGSADGVLTGGSDSQLREVSHSPLLSLPLSLSLSLTPLIFSYCLFLFLRSALAVSCSGSTSRWHTRRCRARRPVLCFGLSSGERPPCWAAHSSALH